jgi:phosphomannomutase
VNQVVQEKQTPLPILKTRDDDGTKLYFDDNSWLLLRFSGTEPILRISAEAASLQKANDLIQWMKGKVTA